MTIQTTRNIISKPLHISLILLLTAGCLASEVRAESLFRAGTTYSADTPVAPRSLFSPPISQHVGDVVTVTINETSTTDTQGVLNITRTQTINENGGGLLNNMIGFILNKLPFNSSNLQNTLSVPTFNGLNNANNMGSKAEASRSNTFQDTISCQVVQVLPNGNLMIQGQKSLEMNKEHGAMVLTGVVNPYYLDKNNQISSQNVGNMQLTQSGKGVISRQQNDGIANKIYQFFN